MTSREQEPVQAYISHEADKLVEECGVFAVASKNPGAIWLAYDAALTQEGRGDQATGIGVIIDGVPTGIVGDGTANKAFDRGKYLAGFDEATTAIAHNLYTTQEKTQPQPFQVGRGLFAMNGNITNADDIADRYQVEVSEKMSDSGKIATVYSALCNQLGSIEEAVKEVTPKLRGAFSMAIIEDDQIIAIRDRVGYRPLHVGELNNGGWAVASETPSFDMIGAETRGTVEPGTYEVITADGVQRSERWGRALHPKGAAIICGMDAEYFARADGMMEEIDIAHARERAGVFLAEDYPVENADMVAPYPDSGRQAATGYALQLGRLVRDVFFKNRLPGKTYTQPVDRIRNSVRLKLNPITSAVKDIETGEGRVIVAVDDSIVRGNTSRETITALKDAGAKEVHMRVAYPPIRFGCDYGMNMKREDGFLADGRTEDEMAELIGADSLKFLTPERFVESLGRKMGEVCVGCATGKYPETDLDHIRAVEEAKAAADRAKDREPALVRA